MNILRKIAISIAATVIAAVAFAQEFPQPMQPARMVNDFSGILTAQQRETLEQKLIAFDKETSTQIAVVTVDDLQGLDVGDYAARLFDRWGIGTGKNNNGILILIKPKTDGDPGRVFISTGYGLEGAVPDIVAGRIVDYEMLPSFKSGDYYAGIDKAVNTLTELTRGEYTVNQYMDKSQPNSHVAVVVVLIIIVILIITSLFGRKGGGHISSSGIPPFILGSLLGGLGRGGGFGGFSGGGGGFGGFGGGMTGGGGAGGSW